MLREGLAFPGQSRNSVVSCNRNEFNPINFNLLKGLLLIRSVRELRYLQFNLGHYIFRLHNMMIFHKF